MELKLAFRVDGSQVETTLTGNNVAEITMQIPETLNQMLRYVNTHREMKDLGPIGVTYEGEKT